MRKFYILRLVDHINKFYWLRLEDDNVGPSSRHSLPSYMVYAVSQYDKYKANPPTEGRGEYLYNIHARMVLNCKFLEQDVVASFDEEDSMTIEAARAKHRATKTQMGKCLQNLGYKRFSEPLPGAKKPSAGANQWEIGQLVDLIQVYELQIATCKDAAQAESMRGMVKQMHERLAKLKG